MRADHADAQNSQQLVRKRAFGWRPKGQRIFVRSFSKRPTATSLESTQPVSIFAITSVWPTIRPECAGREWRFYV
jgi:hypothetical protein